MENTKHRKELGLAYTRRKKGVRVGKKNFSSRRRSGNESKSAMIQTSEYQIEQTLIKTKVLRDTESGRSRWN